MVPEYSLLSSARHPWMLLRWSPDNNRSRGLRRFFRREMSPLLRDQPFDLALWATLSFTPPASTRWGGILLRLATVDSLVRETSGGLKYKAERKR